MFVEHSEKTNISTYIEFKILPVFLPAIRSNSDGHMTPEISHSKGNYDTFTKPLFQLKLVHCAMVISFVSLSSCSGSYTKRCKHHKK